MMCNFLKISIDRHADRLWHYFVAPLAMVYSITLMEKTFISLLLIDVREINECIMTLSQMKASCTCGEMVKIPNWEFLGCLRYNHVLGKSNFYLRMMGWDPTMCWQFQLVPPTLCVWYLGLLVNDASKRVEQKFSASSRGQVLKKFWLFLIYDHRFI